MRLQRVRLLLLFIFLSNFFCLNLNLPQGQSC